MAIQQKRPSAKLKPVSESQDASSYLAQLDELLKRNTGSSTHVGQDTSSNIPMYIPGRVANPTGLGSSASQVFQNKITPPTPVDRPEPQQYVPQQSQNISASDFLDAFQQSYSAPENQPKFGGSEVNFIASTQDGGNLMSDGTIVYDDGTVRIGDPNAVGIQSLADGGILYSDQSIRRPAPQGIQSLMGDRESILYDDGTKRWGQYLYGDPAPGVDLPGSTEGLIQGIFGQDQVITQPYGNYNPGFGYANNRHRGTDIRTRNLTGEQRNFKLPVDAEVVEVRRVGGNNPYGNSILLRLPTGEMLRFSHLDQVINIRPGETIVAGQSFGTPGATGNVDGEHLDLEYYNSQGRIDNPTNFSGFTNPQGLRTPLPGQPEPGTLVEPVNQSVAPQQLQRSTANTRPQPQRQSPQNVFGSVLGATTQQAERLAPQIASGINTLNPTGKNFDLGITETLQGKPEEARQKQISTIEKVGTALKAPELQTNELAQEQGTNPFRQLAGNLIDTASTPLKRVGLPDFGISEAIAGGKTVNTDANLAPQAGASDGLMSKQKQPQDYAKVLGQNINDSVKQAGAGIQSLAKTGIGALENIFKPTETQQTRAVGSLPSTSGEVSGSQSSVTEPGQFSSLMDTAPSLQSSMEKNDIRDPFFKYGGSETYKDFLKPNAEDLSGGALTLDLFKDTFFQNPTNISNIFAGTAMEAPAKGKYNAFVEAENRRLQEEARRRAEDMKQKPGEMFTEWMKRTGGQSQLDAVRSNPRLKLDERSGAISEIGYTPPSSGPEPRKPGESVVEWMKRTGQQSTIDAYGGPQNLNRYFGNSMPNPQSVRTYGTQTGFGVPIMQQGSHIAYSGPGKNLRIDSNDWITPTQNRDFVIGGTPSNLDAPVKTPSATVNYGSIPSGGSNIFSRSKNFLSNIFRR